MPDVTLHPADAGELADILSFTSQWLAHDPRLQTSFAEFTGGLGIQHATTWTASASC